MRILLEFFKNIKDKVKAINDNKAANIGGYKVFGFSGSGPAKTPPIAGPKIKPMPKAAPKGPLL